MLLKTDNYRPYNDPGAITLTFGPGIVRYLDPRDLVADSEAQAIDEIASYGRSPVIEYPWGEFRPEHFDLSDFANDWYMKLDFSQFPSLFEDRPYAELVHEIALIARSYSDFPFPSHAYLAFSQYTNSSRLVLVEFLESWVRETFNNHDLTLSYSESEHHVLVSNGNRQVHVFKRTPFLLQQRAIIDASEKELLEANQRRQHEEVARIFDEAIQKSSFDVFTYLMEDTRNGLIKIGISRNPEVRERTLQSEVPSVTLRIAVPADSEFESELHGQFRHKRRRGEWFELDDLDLKLAVERLLTQGDAARAVTAPEWIGNIYLSAYRGNGAKEQN